MKQVMNRIIPIVPVIVMVIVMARVPVRDMVVRMNMVLVLGLGMALWGVIPNN